LLGEQYGVKTDGVSIECANSTPMRRNPEDVSFPKVVEAGWKYDSRTGANEFTQPGSGFSDENIKLESIGYGLGMWCMRKKSPINSEWAR
jgi:hypothetical protein